MWHTLQTSYRRFETDEVPDVRVIARAVVDGASADSPEMETRSDAEGYFTFDFDTPAGVHGTAFELSLSLPDHQGAVQDGPAEVVLPGEDARFGVISDIDDTILITQATSLLKMMRLTLLESSESRVAFPGVAAFYGALHGGRNPFFYVSSSPWNLHEFLQDFMRLKGIISGPLLLRDFGLDENKLIAGPHLEHKLGQIGRVMDRYPTLPFILVGDSGQPRTRRSTCASSRPTPGACSRSTSAMSARTCATGRCRTSPHALAEHDVEMLLVPDTLAAARHAGRSTAGWTTPALARVSDEVEAELAPREAVDAQTD